MSYIVRSEQGDPRALAARYATPQSSYSSRGGGSRPIVANGSHGGGSRPIVTNGVGVHSRQPGSSYPYAPVAGTPMMQAPGDPSRPLLSDQAGSLRELEQTIGKALSTPATFHEPQPVLDLHDALYRRFILKYGAYPEVQVLFDRNIAEQEFGLLHAITAGNVPNIRSFIGKPDFSWNFVYPPAKSIPDSTGQIIRPLEGWCRSPLGLLIFPDEGNFDRRMRGVTPEERRALVRDVLADGADPNFPPLYWATPTVLACLNGDVEGLDLLRAAGADLTGTVEWAVQQRPAFNLVHAAAFNGRAKVLEYLSKHVPIQLFTAMDAEGCNPLHVLLESSRDPEAATFLLNHGADGFACNAHRRSPLSLAIEHMPAFAKELLQRRSRFEQKWYGNDLYWFSFDGIVLPLSRQGGPFHVYDSNGNEYTIEELMVKHETKELMPTPIMQDLLKLKWKYFGRWQYTKRVIPFALLCLDIFVLSIVNPESLAFKVALVVFFILWLLEMSQLCPRLRRPSFWILLDGVCLMAATSLVVFRMIVAAGLLAQEHTQPLKQYFGILAGLLQVVLAFRLMRMLAMYKVVGPLLITTLEMLKDTLPFLLVSAVILLGFTNGFYAMTHFMAEDYELESYEFDYSYPNLMAILPLAMVGEFEAFLVAPEGLPDVLHWGVIALMALYLATCFIVLLNLLIALYNTTYMRVCEGDHADNEWLFLRLQTLLDYEKDASNPQVQDYYRQLQYFNDRRSAGDLLLTS